MRWTVALAAFLLVSAAAAEPPPPLAPAPTPQPVPTASSTPPEPAQEVAPEALTRGQKGYGLSVFAGTEPDRFEVEVIGVLHHATPELSYIVARLSGQDLETSGVAQGMSGSPVYFDGKLAGAVAFSYLFAQEPIAGITPIAGMRRLREAAGPAPERDPVSASDVATPASAVTLDELAAGVFPAERFDAYLARLRPESRPDAASTVHWHAAGFGEPATGFLRQALGVIGQTAGVGGGQPTGRATGPLGVADGSARDAAARPLEAGAAVAMMLIGGDLSLAAHGTVTEVDGDGVLAFGHPIFGLGPLRVPMARSEVLTTISSVASSFKVSNLGPVIGAFDQDRAAGVHGRLGLEARTVPLTVHLRGAGEQARTYRVRMADLGPFVPALAGSTVLGALGAASYNVGEMGLDLEARLAVAGHDDLTLRQSFDGRTAAVDAAVFLMTYVDYLVANDLEAVTLDAIEVTLEQTPRARAATLTGVHADRQRVEPGERVGLVLELQPHRGAPLRHRIEIEVPAETPNGRYVLLVGDGSSIDAARRLIAPSDPDTIAEALAVLRGYHSRSELVVLGLVPAAGMVVAGDALPALPGSVRSLFAASASRDVGRLSLTILDERAEPAPLPLAGAARLDLEVRRRPR